MKYPEILAIAPAPASFAYDADYTILYALGLGLGAAPEELPFVYEQSLRAFPTMAVMMAQGSGDFIEQGGIDYARIVHGEQRLTIHRPLPPAGTIVSTARCLGVVDKGKEKGALVIVEKHGARCRKWNAPLDCHVYPVLPRRWRLRRTQRWRPATPRHSRTRARS